MFDHHGTEIKVGSKVGIPATVTAIQDQKIYVDIDTEAMGGGVTQRLILFENQVHVYDVPVEVVEEIDLELPNKGESD